VFSSKTDYLLIIILGASEYIVRGHLLVDQVPYFGLGFGDHVSDGASFFMLPDLLL